MTAAAPTAPPPTFAFLVHPRSEVAPDMARVWSPLGVVPEKVWQWGLRHLPVPPLPLARVHQRREHPADGDVAAAGPDLLGHVLVVPVGARQLLTEDRRWVLGKIEQAVDRAVELGASVVGLGALTAPATAGGRLLRERPGVTLTTGNAFTAHLTVEALRRLVPVAPGGHIAVVGATGSVGSCVVRLLADEPIGTELTLVAREPKRLASLAHEVAATLTSRGRPMAVHTARTVAAVREADLVLVLTSASDALLRGEHLKPGAVVLDDTQPRNTDPALARERPDVLVVDGGIAEIPGIDVRGDIGLPRGLAYACLCETMLMALDGHRAHAVGAADVGHARRMRDVARRHAHLGFTLAEPALSFGRPIPWPSATPVLASGVR
ncbi:MAG TPA: NAD(P)H-binding protein [Microlunatus sp.]|nr:NAD(P)H-binding protein [Microlunatus sp.]